MHVKDILSSMTAFRLLAEENEALFELYNWQKKVAKKRPRRDSMTPAANRKPTATAPIYPDLSQ